uniref:Dynein light chain n=1 Tax=Macrostomum lignano TaxID=282301 RepID=A0A1I8G6H5_9PLAT
PPALIGCSRRAWLQLKLTGPLRTQRWSAETGNSGAAAGYKWTALRPPRPLAAATAAPNQPSPAQPTPTACRMSWQKGDMSDELRQAVVEIVNEICSESKDDDSIASNLKKKLDAQLSPTWQVTVGRNFASHVTHEKGTFGYYQYGPYAILMYKAGL